MQRLDIFRPETLFDKYFLNCRKFLNLKASENSTKYGTFPPFNRICIPYGLKDSRSIQQKSGHLVYCLYSR